MNKMYTKNSAFSMRTFCSCAVSDRTVHDTQMVQTPRIRLSKALRRACRKLVNFPTGKTIKEQ